MPHLTGGGGRGFGLRTSRMSGPKRSGVRRARHLTEVPDSVNVDTQQIASELVTNAVEHGAGGSVVVELEHRASEVQVRVESIGVGHEVGVVAAWRVAPAE